MIRVRFAPSPTGYLHIGNTRTALANYLFAKSTKGGFILRIEDTDTERSDARYEASIMEDLRWLGIEWDEGPVRQSDRLDIYRDHAKTLLERGFAYKCFCTKEELEAMRDASLKKGEPPKYNGRCRSLSHDAVKALEQTGKPYVVRFKSLEKQVGFTDIIHGRIDFPGEHVDDFIVLKQGLTPSYNFAATVDDMLMGITHVIRGADHLSNTPKQIMLFQSFGRTPPEYAHHSLLTGNDSKPLSKRHGATNIREFRAMGILPAALINYVGIVGRNVQREFLNKEELIKTFSLDSFSPSDTLFDMEKLFWFNKEYIRKAPLHDLLRASGLDQGAGEKVSLLRENAKTLIEIKDLLNIFESADVSEEGLAYLGGLHNIGGILLEMKGMLGENNNATFDEVLEKLEATSGLKKRDIFMLLRIICTGRKNGPPLGEIFHLIPKDTIMKRVECLTNRFSLP